MMYIKRNRKRTSDYYIIAFSLPTRMLKPLDDAAYKERRNRSNYLTMLVAEKLGLKLTDTKS